MALPEAARWGLKFLSYVSRYSKLSWNTWPDTPHVILIHLTATLRSRYCWCLHYTDEKSETQRPHSQWRGQRSAGWDPTQSALGAHAPSHRSEWLSLHPSLPPPLPYSPPPSCHSFSHTHSLTLTLTCIYSSSSPFTATGSSSSTARRRRGRETPQGPEAPPNPAHSVSY